MLAQVADQAYDVLGNEPPDGAAAVDADHDAPGRAENKAGGSREERVAADESPPSRPTLETAGGTIFRFLGATPR
jgi:hypothetical protein